MTENSPHEMLVRRVARALWTHASKPTEFGPIVRIFSTGLLTRIIDLYFDNDGAPRSYEAVHMTTADYVAWGYPEAYLNDSISHATGLMRETLGSITECLEALSHYRSIGWLPAQQDFEANQNELCFMLVLDKVTSMMKDVHREADPWMVSYNYPAGSPLTTIPTDAVSNTPTTILKDERLVRLIWDRPESSEKIISIVKARHAAEYDTIIDILNTSNPALSEGIL